MRLSDYKNSDRIFIDANIFLDYSLPNPKYGEIASDFLEKIELNEIKAATSPLVLDEVSFIKVIPVNHEDYKQASSMGKNYFLLPSDALHASVMKNNNICNIATRDNDFERVEGISVWKP